MIMVRNDQMRIQDLVPYWELASEGSVEVLRLARKNRLVAKELLSTELDLDIRESLSVEKAAIMLVGRKL